MRILIIIVSIILLAWYSASAQKSPYAGQEIREIKALSPSEIDGYLNGRGMGFAKAAELNHYPGPRHVLDLAKELALTTNQLEKTKSLFESMKKEATKLGKMLIDKEKELDRLFASGRISAKKLENILMEIASIKAKLRYVHLKAHLEQKQILSSHQVVLYDKLRGYGSSHGHHHNHEHSH